MIAQQGITEPAAAIIAGMAGAYLAFTAALEAVRLARKKWAARKLQDALDERHRAALVSQAKEHTAAAEAAQRAAIELRQQIEKEMERRQGNAEARPQADQARLDR